MASADNIASLQTIGWNDRVESEFQAHGQPSDVRARVLAEHKGSYRIWTEQGELSARITGKLMQASHGAEFPATGDFVIATPPDGEGPALIRSVLTRKTVFMRKAAGEKFREQVVAANIDAVFIVAALDHDFNLRRIERYLTLAWDSGAEPVIVLNKADLCDDIDTALREVEEVAIGAPIFTISAQQGAGVDQLDRFLQVGKTVGVLGSSGVGKSTLINGLLGRQAQATQPVRAGDSRGRHTTTHRELFLLPSGASIIDTPGMRELQLLHSEQGYQAAFADIASLAQKCRFADCSHGQEPGCAVRDALERGELDEERFNSSEKLAREMSYAESQSSQASMLERKRFEKVANKAMKQFKKDR